MSDYIISAINGAAAQSALDVYEAYLRGDSIYLHVYNFNSIPMLSLPLVAAYTAPALEMNSEEDTVGGFNLLSLVFVSIIIRPSLSTNTDINILTARATIGCSADHGCEWTNNISVLSMSMTDFVQSVIDSNSNND